MWPSDNEVLISEYEKNGFPKNFVDYVFGGEMTSTIMCQQCKTVCIVGKHWRRLMVLCWCRAKLPLLFLQVSVVTEMFLDLSLPVADEVKPLLVFFLTMSWNVKCSLFICLTCMCRLVTTSYRHTERRTRKKQFRPPLSRASLAESAQRWQMEMMTFPLRVAASTSRRRQRSRRRSRQRYRTEFI